MAELDTPHRALRADMVRRLKDIYVKNHFTVRSKKGDRGVKIIGSEDHPKTKEGKKKKQRA